MKKLILLSCFFLFNSSLFASDVVGFWKTINEHTKKAESIVAIYEHEGKCYGRLILTFHETGQIQDTIYSPKERAPCSK